jgi:hypothetical protein
VRSSHSLGKIGITFDEPNLVPAAGLVAPGELAQRLGVADLIDERLHLRGAPGAANAGVKAMTVIGGVLAGADSIDDMDLMRAGATNEVFAVRAPSTIGTFLRSFSFGDVRSLDAVSRELLVRAWAAGMGPAAGADVTVDMDSTICQVYGTSKQGAGYGYTSTWGLHPLLATCAGDEAGGGAGQVLATRLRGGSANTARGAGSFTREALNRLADAMPADEAGRKGRVLLRADSGFYSRGVIRAARRAGARFSITVRSNKAIQAAIAGIDEQAWTPIPYWSSDVGAFGYHDDGTPVSGADVAEVDYTAFAGSRDAVRVRLVVRRVRPTPGTQLALFTEFAHHALVTDRPGDLLEIEADHRRHAVVEQVIADLKGGAGWAHMPSGKFASNAAWIALTTMAHNLSRWCAALTGGRLARAGTARMRRTLFAIPGRLVHKARGLLLRLPIRWPWQQELADLRTAIAEISPVLS